MVDIGRRCAQLLMRYMAYLVIGGLGASCHFDLPRLSGVDAGDGLVDATNSGVCGDPIACPVPSTGKQTICGQLYDFETDQPFAASGPMGTRCQAGVTAGPCALNIRAYDGVAFGMNPGTAVPLPVGEPTSMTVAATASPRSRSRLARSSAWASTMRWPAQRGSRTRSAS